MIHANKFKNNKCGRSNFLLIVCLAFLLLFFYKKSNAQTELPYSNKFTVVAGVSQVLLLDGFNIAANYTTNRWVFEYSHGNSLDYSGEVLRPEYRTKVDQVHSPFSTGAGVGYRIFARPIIAMDIRAEAKVHKYEVALNSAQSVEYINFDLGGGVYWQIRPFGKSGNALKGIVIEPSIRYWRNISSNLEDNFTYLSEDGNQHIHEPYPLNLFANVSIGYTFGVLK